MLEQPRDRDLALGERVGDAGEHAGPVVDREVEVERRAVLAVREPRQVAPDRVVLQEAGAHRPDHARHVGDHGGGRLDAAGAGPLERDLADRVALEHHGVERALDRRERMVAVDERRADAHVDLAVEQPRRADEPDHHVELARGGDVERRDRVDPDHLDVGEREARVEGDRREDRHLRRRVGAGDVVGRVGLGEAARLGLARAPRRRSSRPPSR